MTEWCLFLYTLKDKFEIELLSALTLWFIVNSKKAKKIVSRNTGFKVYYLKHS